MGDEYGLRVLLQGRWIAQYRITMRVTKLGLIWAARHLPIILTRYNYRPSVFGSEPRIDFTRPSETLISEKLFCGFGYGNSLIMEIERQDSIL
jgi:hypothetical protein